MQEEIADTLVDSCNGLVVYSEVKRTLGRWLLLVKPDDDHEFATQYSEPFLTFAEPTFYIPPLRLPDLAMVAKNTLATEVKRRQTGLIFSFQHNLAVF